MPPHTRASRNGRVTALRTGTLARIGHRYLLAVWGALFAFAFWIVFSLSLWPLLQPGATSAVGAVPGPDLYPARSLSKEAVWRSIPPRDDE